MADDADTKVEKDRPEPLSRKVYRLRVSHYPRIIKKSDTPLKVIFPKKPKNIDDVRLRVVEMDVWRYGGTKKKPKQLAEGGSTEHQTIAHFVGSLDNGKFEWTALKISDAKIDNPPILKLQFCDRKGTAYADAELAIPDASLRTESGELEFALQFNAYRKVTAKRWRRIEGSRKKERVEYVYYQRYYYKNDYPVFYRNYGNNVPLPRPVLTFLSGKLDSYKRLARRYWKRRADGVLRRHTIEAIFDYLQNNVDGPLGELNVVSHANINQWLIRMFYSAGRKPGVVNIRSMRDFANDDRFSTPDADVLDRSSRVVIRGCVLGDNQELLNRIKALFGGRATVYAPRYIQWYQPVSQRRAGPAECFWDYWFFYVRGTRPPGLNERVRMMMDKYPGHFDKKKWRRLLQNKGDRLHRKDKIRKIVKEKWVFHVRYDEKPLKKTRAQWLDDLRSAWPDDPADSYDTNTDDWRWFVGKRKYKKKWGHWRVYFTGRRCRVEVRQPLRDANGSLVVPNLYDRGHYGVSE